MLTKSRMQVSSIVITLPLVNGKKPEPNKEYLVVYSPDGTILLVPKLSDPFADGRKENFMNYKNGKTTYLKGDNSFNVKNQKIHSY